MKKTFFITFQLLFCLVACKSTYEIEAPQELTLRHTWPEVIAIAAQHGVDSTYIPYEKQSALMLDDEAEIAKFAIATKLALDKRDQNRAFMQNTYRIRSFTDYEALLELYPLLLESEHKWSGWEAWRKKMSTGTWHIYRDANGGLRWVRPEQDKGYYEGEERIDNKPPVGMPQK